MRALVKGCMHNVHCISGYLAICNSVVTVFLCGDSSNVSESHSSLAMSDKKAVIKNADMSVRGDAAGWS